MLVTRAADDAAATAARLTALGHEAIVAPLLAPRVLAWTPPGGRLDAVALTSPRALMGGVPVALLDLPCFAVGAASAGAARAAGFARIRAGHEGAHALWAAIAAAGAARVLWLAGRERTEAAVPPGLDVVVCETYAVDLVPLSPAAVEALRASDITALLYSARTAAWFAAEVDAHVVARGSVRVAALSEAVLAAAGSGWRYARAAVVPTEAALFVAGKLTR